MAGPGTLVVLVALLLFAVLQVGLVLDRRADDDTLPRAAATTRRRAARWAVLALVAGLLVLAGAATVARTHPGAERPVLLAPVLAAGAHAGVSLLGELLHPRPTRRVRSARLRPRSLWSSVRGPLLPALVVGGALLLAACTASVVLTGPTGNALEYVTADGAVQGSASFPAGATTLPLGLLLLVAYGLTGATLLRLRVRPALPGVDPAIDVALRRTCAHRVVRVTASAALGTLGLLLLRGAIAFEVLGSRFDPLTTDTTPGPAAGWYPAATNLGLLALLLGVAVLFVPARGLRRTDVPRLAAPDPVRN